MSKSLSSVVTSAPLGASTLELEQALAELIDKIVPELDSGDLLADAKTASKALSSLQLRQKNLEFTLKEWNDKTEWVQRIARSGELGMHRADIMKKLIDDKVAET